MPDNSRQTAVRLLSEAAGRGGWAEAIAGRGFAVLALADAVEAARTSR